MILYALSLCAMCAPVPACTQANQALDDAAKAKAELEGLRVQVVDLMARAERTAAEGKARCDAALVVLREVETAAPLVCSFVPAGDSEQTKSAQSLCAKQPELSAAVLNVEKACGLIGSVGS